MAISSFKNLIKNIEILRLSFQTWRCSRIPWGPVKVTAGLACMWFGPEVLISTEVEDSGLGTTVFLVLTYLSPRVLNLYMTSQKMPALEVNYWIFYSSNRLVQCLNIFGSAAQWFSKLLLCNRMVVMTWEEKSHKPIVFHLWVTPHKWAIWVRQR